MTRQPKRAFVLDLEDPKFELLVVTRASRVHFSRQLRLRHSTENQTSNRSSDEDRLRHALLRAFLGDIL